MFGKHIFSGSKCLWQKWCSGSKRFRQKSFKKSVLEEKDICHLRFLSNRNISLFSELKGILISRIYFISCAGHVREMTKNFGPINAYEGARAARHQCSGSNEMLFI